MAKRLIISLTLLAATPVAASNFLLDWPIDCSLGTTCHIQQYVDHDPGPSFQDFRCNRLSYDTHKGTDIAVPYLSDMQAGVDVLAAADGIVVGLRDGMADRFATSENLEEIKGRECGNGVVLRHEGGWETQYCHMKQGSVRVQKGQALQAGDALGQVGLSGKTEFPHLHLSVRRNGAVVDPFAPDADFGSAPTECVNSDAGEALWRSPIPYSPAGFLGSGFSAGIPAFSSIRAGEADASPLPADAKALVFWAYAFGGRKGDQFAITIVGPNGPFLSQTVELEKSQAQFFRASGKRLRTHSWTSGTYTGRAVLSRNGEELTRIEQQMLID